MSIEQIYTSFRTSFFISLALLIMPQLTLSEPLKYQEVTIDVSNLTPTTSEMIYLDVVGSIDCKPYLDIYAVDIDYTIKSVKVVLDADDYNESWQPCYPDLPTHAPITKLNAGNYVLSIYHPPYFFPPEDLPYYAEEDLIGAFDIVVSESAPTALSAEVPAASSIQSGVGMVRGWVCDAARIEVAFDEQERIPVAYGTTREDTRERCGDANNGYGMVVNWGALSKGIHRMTTFIDGNQVAEVEFEVSGLDDPFVKDLSATYQLDDFPAPDESVTVRWSEAHQNFIIIEQH